MSEFDYIVVGSGSGGSVMAERLSADPRNRVLLIEEGTVNDDMLVRMPKGFGKQLMDAGRTHFIPVSRTKEGNQPEVWVRGKQMGGSSSVNGMVWTRGQPPDWDRLGELAGPEWSWSEMLPVYKRIENHGDGESELRGVGGPIDVKTNPEPSPLVKAWIAAGREMGLPLKPDQNQVEQEGIGLLQWNIDKRGRRVSAAHGFLGRAKGRSNLKIETGVRTDRVVIENGRAVAVVGVRDGQPVRFETRGEIILCAGAIGSTKILQLSGIGPAQVLGLAGVPVILDCPDIGRHMREHILTMVNWRMKRMADGSENKSYAGVNLFGNVLRWLLLGKGPLAHGSSPAVAWARILEGSQRPDAQIMFNPYSIDPRTQGFEAEPGCSVFTMITKPQSEGSIEITSADPVAPLRIQPNYLSDERDQRVQVGAIRYVRELMSQPALSGMLLGETDDTRHVQSDEEILDLFSRRGQSGYHAVGVARMGKDSGPVDGRLRVRGVDALRICDCSVFPEMISGNTNAPTMAIAYRGSELILADRKA